MREKEEKEGEEIRENDLLSSASSSSNYLFIYLLLLLDVPSVVAAPNFSDTY